MPTNTTNMHLPKPDDSDNAEAAVHGSMSQAFDIIDPHKHTGGTDGLQMVAGSYAPGSVGSSAIAASVALTTPSLASPTITGTVVGPVKILNGTAVTSHATTNQPAVESGTVAVANTGTTVTFAHAFSAAPNVVAVVTDGTGACWVPVITAVTATQFTVFVFDKTDTKVAKSIMWFAVGNDS